MAAHVLQSALVELAVVEAGLGRGFRRQFLSYALGVGMKRKFSIITIHVYSGEGA